MNASGIRGEALVAALPPGEFPASLRLASVNFHCLVHKAERHDDSKECKYGSQQCSVGYIHAAEVYEDKRCDDSIRNLDAVHPLESANEALASPPLFSMFHGCW